MGGITQTYAHLARVWSEQIHVQVMQIKRNLLAVLAMASNLLAMASKLLGKEGYDSCDAWEKDGTSHGCPREGPL